jgi:hypothetical protein
MEKRKSDRNNAYKKGSLLPEPAVILAVPVEKCKSTPKKKRRKGCSLQAQIGSNRTQKTARKLAP